MLTTALGVGLDYIRLRVNWVVEGNSSKLGTQEKLRWHQMFHKAHFLNLCSITMFADVIKIFTAAKSIDDGLDCLDAVLDVVFKMAHLVVVFDTSSSSSINAF